MGNDARGKEGDSALGIVQGPTEMGVSRSPWLTVADDTGIGGARCC